MQICAIEILIFLKNTMNKFYLMIPIFELYAIVEISEVVFNSSVSEYIKDQRGLEDRKKIFIKI